MAGYSTFLIFGEFGEFCKCLGEKNSQVNMVDVP